MNNNEMTNKITGEDVDFTAILDPHIVAGLLKMYVRELAEPLLTFELVCISTYSYYKNILTLMFYSTTYFLPL